MVRLFVSLAAFTTIQRCFAVAIQMKCDPGFYRANASSENCEPCPHGTYADVSNRELTCHDCTRCSAWPRTIIECNATHDRVCGCHEGYDKSPDGCIKNTAETNPLSNITASVERIEQYLAGLRTTLNDTHGEIIWEMSRELSKLNRTLSDVLDHIETLTIQIARSGSSKLSNLPELNQMREIALDTHEYARKSTELLIATLTLLGVYVIIVLLWEFWKEKLYYFCAQGQNCCKRSQPKAGNGPSVAYASQSGCTGYMPLDIKVSKDVQQIRDAIFGNMKVPERRPPPGLPPPPANEHREEVLTQPPVQSPPSDVQIGVIGLLSEAKKIQSELTIQLKEIKAIQSRVESALYERVPNSSAADRQGVTSKLDLILLKLPVNFNEIDGRAAGAVSPSLAVADDTFTAGTNTPENESDATAGPESDVPRCPPAASTLSPAS